jgi:hypothetical protein
VSLRLSCSGGLGTFVPRFTARPGRRNLTINLALAVGGSRVFAEVSGEGERRAPVDAVDAVAVALLDRPEDDS